MPSPAAPPALSELTARQMRWIAGGAVMTLATLPGQTSFIAQFNTALRTEFDLSHGSFGGLYTLATLASASGLVFAGGLADRVPLPRLAAGAMLCLALAGLAMSQVGHVALLVVVLAALRFFGQGMLMLVAMTAMARWFHRFRGRALSLATFGFIIGESLLPFTITVSIAAYGWRSVWLATATALAVLLVPLLLLLLRDAPGGRRAAPAEPGAPPPPAPTGAEWTRARLLRDPLFYMILPGIMAPPAIGTLFIFHQANLVALKGWSLTVFTAWFPVLSLTVAATSIVAGVLIDRFGAWRLMPVLLVPLGVTCILIGTLHPASAIPLIFLGVGLTQGMMNPVIGALWVEVYGSAHLGAIRALVTAALVAASAVGPGIAGLLIDAGVTLETQAFGYAAWCLVCSAAYLTIQPRFRTRVALIA